MVEIDWVEGLQAGFAINNPNVSAACGCGHSFQVEEGDDAHEASADTGGCGVAACGSAEKRPTGGAGGEEEGGSGGGEPTGGKSGTGAGPRYA